MDFTRVPNKIIDELKLNPYQFQLLAIIVRKTDGWCKTEDGISLSQFENLVTFSKNTIIKAIKELQNMGLIEVANHYDKTKKQHSYNTYKVSQGVVHEMNKGSSRDEQGVVHEMNKQKKLNTKETNTKQIKKKNLPSFVDEVLFDEYLEVRKKMKLSNSDRVISRLVNSLNMFHEKGLDANESLEKAITSGWKDLYEPKNDTPKKNGYSRPAPLAHIPQGVYIG